MPLGRMDADVIIIGSGQAGVPLATRLAAAGKRVLLAERAQLGGTCVNYGCTPTKTLIASAQAAHDARTAARLGVDVGDVRVDARRLFDRVRAIVGEWRAGVDTRLRAAGERLRVVAGAARLVGPREVEIGGVRHHAATIVLNVGARPALPRVAGLDAVPWLDNHRALELGAVPKHLVVLGGGYIGCELGQAFRRLGAEVTIVQAAPHLLPREDPDVSQTIEQAFRAEGLALRLGGRVERVERDREVITVHLGGDAVRASHLLVATGRRPNTDDLGCEAAGVRLDERGWVVADEHYQTSQAGIFAVGDVLGGPQFTHTSWDDHRLLFDHLMGRRSRSRHARHIPYTVFTDPQLASVGLNEASARQGGVAYELATMPFAAIARARETDARAGLMKLLFDPRADRILGVTLVGAQVGELIHIFIALMQADASPRAIADAEFVHPTFAEGVQSLVMRLHAYSLS